ncbi:MAG TPA: hypothetical protein VHO46_04440 [Bacteroidales bacterium]|nr:hypothetical protein [Bacteroidales bacterium]
MIRFKTGALIILTVVTGASGISQVNSRIENPEIKGPVKSLFSETRIIDTRNNKSVADSSFYLFDNKGNVLKVVLYDKDGICQQIDYTYDNRDRILTKNGFSFGDKFSYSYKYFENENARLLRIECIHSSGPVEYKTYIYDTEGRLAELSEYDTDSLLKNRKLYEYDTDGNLTRQITFDPSNGLASSELFIPASFKYNESGRKTEERGFNISGNYAYLYRYDDKGNMAESYQLFDSGILNDNGEVTLSQGIINDLVQSISEQYNTSKVTYKYDSFGRETESYCIDNGYRSTKKYDKNGNITEDNDSTWEYEYDTSGNWIKKVRYLNKESQVP